MQEPLGIYLVTRQAGAPADKLSHAYVGFRLQACGEIAAKERIACQTLLLTRFQSAIAALPGSQRALEVRYVVHPGHAGNAWREDVTCYILARLTEWQADRPALRLHAVRFAQELRHVLASTLPGYRFAPLATVADVRAALQPFPLADTGEVRHRVVETTGESALPLPLLGIPDADLLVSLMLRQSAPTLLAFAFAPVELDDSASLTPIPAATAPPPDIAVGAIRQHEDGSPLPSMDVLTRTHDAQAAQRWQVQHLVALRQRAFRCRLQIASVAPLGDALIASIIGEVGGPGRLTAEAAWQEPTLPLASGAVWARPRSSKPRAHAKTEFAVALENLATLGFEPWNPPDEPAINALADLGEAARLCGLPTEATWLPEQDVALKLPFNGGLEAGMRLGVNRVRDTEKPVSLPLASRKLHLWIVGQTGTGKSTLLESLILQDVYAGRGVIAIDPHGDLINQILGKIPAQRKKDVILFDPADTAHIVGVNPLQAQDEAQKALVVSAFLALLRKIYDPFNQGITGPRFEHAARNGLLTVMSAPGGGTLIEFMRAFTDDSYRNSLLPYVTDPIVKRYWTDQIARTQDFHRSEVLDWVVSKFGRFVTDPTIRRIIGQPQSSFSFREAMDGGKIVLLSLAKGLVGSDNANFLGLVLLPMILHAALSRANIPESERRDVALYIDEFQNYATDSLALMLAEARKYRLALTLANQHVGQLTPEIRDAVIGNVGSILAFRLGVADAAMMEHILAPSAVCTPHLIGLPNFTAYGRLQVGGQRIPAFTLATEPVAQRYDARRATAVRAASHKKYARPHADVDAAINERAQLLEKPRQRFENPFRGLANDG